MPGNADWEHPDSVAAERRAHAALLTMLETRPTSMVGFAALADVLWSLQGPVTGPGSSGRAEASFAESIRLPENRLVQLLWEAGSGRTGPPPSAALNSVGEDWFNG